MREARKLHVEATGIMRQTWNGRKVPRKAIRTANLLNSSILWDVPIGRKSYFLILLEYTITLVYSRLFLYYQHKIRKYQQTWRSMKSRKRLRKVVEAAENMVSRRKESPVKNNNHPMPMNILTGTISALAKKGPKCTMKTIKKLGLYASTHFKNGSDVKKCIKKVSLVSNPPPVLPQDPTDNEKKVW